MEKQASKIDNTSIDSIIVRTLEESDLDADLDRKIKNCLVECFPKDREYFTKQSWWFSKPVYRIMAFEDSEVVCGHIAIVERRISVGVDSLRVAGVQSLFVMPTCRGKGLSSHLVELAMKEAAKRHIEAGLLFCVPELERTYAKMGWIKVNSKIVMKDQTDKHICMPEKNIAMYYPILATQWPAGEVDLCGLDW